MMTRDHIIPKSLGGIDSVQNLRPGCEVCNGGRGSKMNKADKKFMTDHPELISAARVAKGLENKARAEAALAEQQLKNLKKKLLGETK